MIIRQAIWGTWQNAEKARQQGGGMTWLAPVLTEPTMKQWSVDMRSRGPSQATP